jgi:transglutaminase-like putative cysteine protease
MLRLRIRHHTTYSYERPVGFGRHRLVLRPREGHDLRVDSMKLEIEPAHRLMWVRDVFGNSVALLDLLEDSSMLTIASDVVVHRSAHFPARQMHEPWLVPFPVSYDPLEAPVSAAYLTVSYPEEIDEMKSWLRELKIDRTDAEGTMLALCNLIHEKIGYQRRSEKGVQNPALTLELESGSCRDMATLMMECARVLGIAARFASGYLHCAASMAGHASTHAWTEVYLPDLGWRGFDPTTGDSTSLKHVATGVSNHPRGVMPITGMYIGSRADYRDMRVQVETEELENTDSDVLA